VREKHTGLDEDLHLVSAATVSLPSSTIEADVEGRGRRRSDRKPTEDLAVCAGRVVLALTVRPVQPSETMIANQNSGCDSCNQLKRVVARPDVNSVNIPRLHRYTRRGPHSPPHLSSHPSLTTYQLRSYTNKYQRLSIVYSARAERHKFRGVKGFAISHPGRRAALTLQSRAGLHSDCGRPTTTTRPASCGLHCVRYVIKYISCWRGRLADVEQDPDQGGISLLSD